MLLLDIACYYLLALAVLVGVYAACAFAAAFAAALFAPPKKPPPPEAEDLDPGRN